MFSIHCYYWLSGLGHILGHWFGWVRMDWVWSNDSNLFLISDCEFEFKTIFVLENLASLK